MSTAEDIAAGVSAATTILGFGMKIFDAVKAQAEAKDEAEAAAARERRKHALMQLEREAIRQRLELEMG